MFIADKLNIMGSLVINNLSLRRFKQGTHWDVFTPPRKQPNWRKFLLQDNFSKTLIIFDCLLYTDKKKTKFSSYIRKFRMEQLQSHIWLMASSYIGKYLRIFSYIKKPFLICSMTLQLLHSEFPYIWGKLYFLFISVLWRAENPGVVCEGICH